jgi:hypothetical protein
MKQLGHLLVGQPDLAEGIMRALAIKGAPPYELEPQYGLSVNVMDLTAPEFLWARRVMRLSQGIVLNAVAAQFSQAAFTPIAGAARTMCVVEKLFLTNTNAAASTFLIDSQPSTAVTAAPGVPKSGLDDRALPFNQLQPTPSFGLVSLTAAAALTGTGAMVFALPSQGTLVLDLNWVFTARVPNTLPAPSSLLIQNGTVNTSMHAAVVWRERTLLASEAT